MSTPTLTPAHESSTPPEGWPVLQTCSTIETADDPATLAAEAAQCRRCDLYQGATHLVFGAGPAAADIVIVGEQPGDQEDRHGAPFIGPSGRLLDRALVSAGIERERCYVTNAVKHFKHTLRGKRRLHKKPNAGEIKRCAWWLTREIAAVQPRLIVALGATAAYALFGRTVKIAEARGQTHHVATSPPVLVTLHPSYLLRRRGNADADYETFVGDLSRAQSFLR